MAMAKKDLVRIEPTSDKPADGNTISPLDAEQCGTTLIASRETEALASIQNGDESYISKHSYQTDEEVGTNDIAFIHPAVVSPIRSPLNHGPSEGNHRGSSRHRNDDACDGDKLDKQTDIYAGAYISCSPFGSSSRGREKITSARFRKCATPQSCPKTNSISPTMPLHSRSVISSAAVITPSPGVDKKQKRNRSSPLQFPKPRQLSQSKIKIRWHGIFLVILVSLSLLSTGLSIILLISASGSTKIESFIHALQNYTKPKSSLPSTLTKRERQQLENFAASANVHSHKGRVVAATASKLNSYTIRFSWSEGFSAFDTTASPPSKRRLNNLIEEIEHFLMCSNISQIQIVGQGESFTSPNVRKKYDGRVVLIDSFERSPLESISTDAVLLLRAEDYAFQSISSRFSCEMLDQVFKLWKNNPSRMVGFNSFNFVASGTDDDAPQQKYIPVTLSPVLASGSYNIVSDSGAFVHRLYLDAPTPQGTHCDNFALSLKITMLSRQPPMAVFPETRTSVAETNHHRITPSLTFLKQIRRVEQNRLKDSVACIEHLMELLYFDSIFEEGELPEENLTFLGLS